MGNTPPSSPPLGLPPPIGISSEVALMEASSEYDDISSSFSTHTPKARASFIKDKAVRLLRGATIQAYFGPVYTSTTQEGEEGLDDIVRVGTLHVGFKGYDRMPFEFSFLGQFSMASLKSIVSFLSSGSIEPNLEPGIIQDIFEKDATTEVCMIGFVSNMNVCELKPGTSSCTCPTDIQLRYKHPVEDGYGQRLGGLTKWINSVLLASSDNTRNVFCMKVSETFGNW